MEQMEAQRQLEDLGFVVLPDFIQPEWLTELQLATERQFELEGDEAGSEFRQETGSRRLANLCNKGDTFRRVIVEPRLLQFVELLLGPGFKLSSLNARSANPHNDVSQPLHADMGAVADEHGYWVCNSVWMLDDFTADNGALRVVPGSHRFNQLPQDALCDPAAPHPDEVLVTGKAGTVVVMNAHCWHGGTANRTNRPRTALHAFYCRRDKPQQQYQQRLLAIDVLDSLSDTERRVLAIDDPQNDAATANNERLSGFLK
ncbi:MAG: phytanoyl-CoA dioxygenase family protein [Planctomycetota bacterium]|jgi:ectoine hydroxylase-related dioxygenase (phytanoyl-CoA dioxygenase family)